MNFVLVYDLGGGRGEKVETGFLCNNPSCSETVLELALNSQRGMHHRYFLAF